MEYDANFHGGKFSSHILYFLLSSTSDITETKTAHNTNMVVPRVTVSANEQDDDHTARLTDHPRRLAVSARRQRLCI